MVTGRERERRNSCPIITRCSVEHSISINANRFSCFLHPENTNSTFTALAAVQKVVLICMEDMVVMHAEFCILEAKQKFFFTLEVKEATQIMEMELRVATEAVIPDMVQEVGVVPLIFDL